MDGHGVATALLLAFPFAIPIRDLVFSVIPVYRMRRSDGRTVAGLASAPTIKRYWRHLCARKRGIYNGMENIALDETCARPC